jgi:hypothetical protein
MTTDDMLDRLLNRLGGEDFKCTRQKDGKVCARQYTNKFDKENRPIFYFATGCKVVESFCPACLAYWHVAVARNCLDTAREYEADDEAEAIEAVKAVRDAEARRDGPGEFEAINAIRRLDPVVVAKACRVVGYDVTDVERES